MSVDSINVFRTALVKWEGYKIACQVDSDKKGEEFEAQFAKRQASFLGDFASCKTPSSFAGDPEISAFAFREGVRVLVLQRQGELQVSDKKIIQPQQPDEWKHSFYLRYKQKKDKGRPGSGEPLRCGHFDVLVTEAQSGFLPVKISKTIKWVDDEKGTRLGLIRAQNTGHCGFACLLFFKKLMTIMTGANGSQGAISDNEAHIVGTSTESEDDDDSDYHTGRDH